MATDRKTQAAKEKIKAALTEVQKHNAGYIGGQLNGRKIAALLTAALTLMGGAFAGIYLGVIPTKSSVL